MAVFECDLLCVVPEKFSDVMNKNPTAYVLACTYAQNFAKWMNTVDMDEQSDIIQGDTDSERHVKFMELEDGTKDAGIEHPKNKPIFQRSWERMRSVGSLGSGDMVAQLNKRGMAEERREEAVREIHCHSQIQQTMGFS